MLKFLLDSNISWQTAKFLESLGYKAKTVAQFGLTRANDQDISNFAAKKRITIITLDLDFGEIYYFSGKIQSGTIVLKLKNQTVESVNNHLEYLLRSKILKAEDLKKSLIIFDGKKIRIKRKNN